MQLNLIRKRQGMSKAKTKKKSNWTAADRKHAEIVIEKETIRRMIIQQNLTIEKVADYYDVGPERIEYILFKKQKINQENINKAFHMYDEGFCILHAAVASGVAPDKLKYELKNRGRSDGVQPKRLHALATPAFQYLVGF